MNLAAYHNRRFSAGDMNKDVRKLFLIFTTMLLVLITSAIVLFVFGSHAIVAREAVTRNREVIFTLDDTLSILKDAETGARGYLLAENEAFLSPYNAAIKAVASDISSLDRWVTSGDLTREEATDLEAKVANKLSRLAETIEMQRSGHHAEVIERVKSGEGKQAMDEVRATIAQIKNRQIAVMTKNEERSSFLGSLRTEVFVGCTLVNIFFLIWSAGRIKREMNKTRASAAVLGEQRELYATTLASIGDAVVTTDEKGLITFMNQVAVELTGWSLADSIGKPLATVFKIISESTRLPSESPVEKVLRLGTIVGLANHTLLIRKDGSEIPIDDSGAPIRHADQSIRGVVLVFRDFSEHKRSEAALLRNSEQMRLATEAADLGMFYCTYPLDRIVWNDQCKAHFFLPPDAEVDFKLFYSLLHPDDREPTRQAIEKAEKEHVPYDIEYRAVSQHGRERWIRAAGRFYYDAHARPTRFDGVTMDITDRKAREKTIQEARAQAEAANKAKDQFLATLSHELRTPLTPVLATLGMWDKSDGTPAGFHEDVQMLRRNIELEARLIDDLLDLTRVVKGKLTVSLEKIDVHDLLHHVANVCKEDVQSKKIDLKLKLDAPNPIVKADSARLQQVLWNILRNAVKFSPRQSGVDVATSNTPEGNLHITVSDHGIGMTPQTMQKLFKPFEQGSDEITRRFGGLGLGLAISKALVDAQGGTIQAASEGLGRGSTFTIELPSLTAKEAAAATPKQPASAEENGRHLRILLAEDHVDTARILKLVMSNWGHQVETAGSVAGAVDLAKENRFDLVISDIGLPDGTGLDLMRAIRKFSQVPAIALTGYGMDEDIAATRQAGFNAHLTKPTDLTQLQTSIAKLSQPADSLQA